MHNPTKAQVQIVIDTLNKAVEMAEGNCPVDMAIGRVNFKHPCGTPACHGGWYALASKIGVSKQNRKNINYETGKQQMAVDLGFTSGDRLKDWAIENPALWGNDDGDYMFCSDCAFGSEPITSLQQIIFHWQSVQTRLPQ